KAPCATRTDIRAQVLLLTGKSLVWKPVPKLPIFRSGVGLERVCPSASHMGLLRIPPAVGVQSEAERRGARDSKSLVPEQQDVLGVRSDCGRSAIVRAGVDPRVWCVPRPGH